MGVDATDLFDRYDEDFDEMPGGGFPHIEINKMHISQSIEVQKTYTYLAFTFHTAPHLCQHYCSIVYFIRRNLPVFFQAPLTNSDTAVLSGSLSTHNGNGGGNINMTVRRVTSAKGWGEVHTHAHLLQTTKQYIKQIYSTTYRGNFEQ